MKKTQIFISNKIERLDIFLASEIGQSRSQISQLIKQNCIYIDEKLDDDYIKKASELKDFDGI